MPVFVMFYARDPKIRYQEKQLVALSFIGCSAFEFLQKAGLYHGTFDRYDFVAYAAGSTIAYGINKYFSQGRCPITPDNDEFRPNCEWLSYED